MQQHSGSDGSASQVSGLKRRLILADGIIFNFFWAIEFAFLLFGASKNHRFLIRNRHDSLLFLSPALFHSIKALHPILPRTIFGATKCIVCRFSCDDLVFTRGIKISSTHRRRSVSSQWFFNMMNGKPLAGSISRTIAKRNSTEHIKYINVYILSIIYCIFWKQC